MTGEPDEAEGWYVDPYALHEERWYSAGTPTPLVRDHGVESHDDPPRELPIEEPVEEAPYVEAVNGDDLKRADMQPTRPFSRYMADWQAYRRD